MLSNILNNLWWKFMPGSEIIIKCPHDLISIPSPFNSNRHLIGTLAYFSPDNSRNKLEKIVGTKGWDWDWYMIDYDQLKIKFRIGKTQYASYFLMIWN